ncbi:MAG: hypothetical protein AB1758_10015 [Candidatus Eremiobacterota bacterium]
MPEIDSVNSGGEAFQAFMARMKENKKDKEGEAPSDQVTLDPATARETLAGLLQKAAALQKEIKQLTDGSVKANRDAGKAFEEGRQLETQANAARGEAIQAQQEASRADVESKTEEGKADDTQRASEEAQAEAEAWQREAEVLRSQGERMLGQTRGENQTAAQEDALEHITMAAERQNRAQQASGKAGTLRTVSIGHRQAAGAGRQRQRDAQQTGTEADRRSNELTEGARKKQGESANLRLEAQGLDNQRRDSEMELALLQKDMDELIELASQVQFIVVTVG